MAYYEDETVGAYGDDPLTEESKEVLRRAQIEMTDWVKKTVKESTDGLKAEISNQVGTLESAHKELNAQIDAVYVSLDKMQRTFEETLRSRFATLDADSKLIKAASEALTTSTLEAKRDLQRKKELCEKAGQATVTAMKRFAGIP